MKVDIKPQVTLKKNEEKKSLEETLKTCTWTKDILNFDAQHIDPC